MENKGEQRTGHTSVIAVATDHFSIHDEPRATADVLKSIYQCALGNPEMRHWTAQEHSDAYESMEAVIVLLNGLHGALLAETPA